MVVSALAVHHLDGAGKADLFHRVADRLGLGGRFVLGDVVVPDDPADALTPLDEGYDLPDRLPDLVEWMVAAGFGVLVVWTERDLAVVVGEKPG